VEGKDFMGGDMIPDSLHFNTTSAAACCAACQQHGGCQAWGWGHKDHPRLSLRCYLKKIVTGRTADDAHMTSGYPGKAPPAPPPPPALP